MTSPNGAKALAGQRPCDDAGHGARPRDAGAAELGVAVDVLVEQIAEFARAAGIAGLRAEGAQPHVVAGLDLDPVLVEPIDRLALQHVEAVLHHMGLGEGNDGAGLEGDDGDMHVVAHVGRDRRSASSPSGLGVGHRRRRDVLLVGEEGSRHVDALDRLVGLADPVEADGGVGSRCAPSSRWPAEGRHSRPAA